MKIFIPYPVKDIGGTSIFIKKFQKGMEARGHEVFFEYRPDFDFLLAVVVCYPQYLPLAKWKKKKIVQRLDGVFYYSSSGWNFLRLNFSPWLIRKFFADFLIYQSKYSEYCNEKFLGKSSLPKALIYNGIDLETFSPEGEIVEGLRDNPEQQIFITASKFRRKDQIEPIIEALKIYQKKYSQNFKCLFIGSFIGKVGDIPRQYEDLPFCNFVGKVKNEDLPKYLRSADVFLLTHLNPPCPNNVLEAMGCSLPICGVADGAMTEITEPGVNSLLIPVQGDAFWKPRKYDCEKFADNLSQIMQHREEYATQSRKIAEEKFNLEKMVDNYIEALSTL